MHAQFPLPGSTWLRRLATAGVLWLAAFAQEAAALKVPDKEIRLARVALPALAAGSLQNHRIAVGDLLVGGVVYTARLEETEWEEGRLKLGFFGPSPAEPRDLAPEVRVRRGDELLLRVMAGACCSGIRPETRIRLEPDARSDSRGEPVLPIVLPVSIQVEKQFDKCEDRRIRSTLQATLAGTIALYLHSMFANSRFLKRRRIASRLKPLTWDGRRHVQEKQPLDIEQMIRRDLRFWRRAWNWLRANPLSFGLPGRAYYETVEIVLASQENASQLILQPHGDLYESLGKDSSPGKGRLFLTARGERIFGVPDNNRLSGLLRMKFVGRERMQGDGRIDLEREEKLLYLARSGRQSVGRSGWEIC